MVRWTPIAASCLLYVSGPVRTILFHVKKDKRPSLWLLVLFFLVAPTVFYTALLVVFIFAWRHFLLWFTAMAV